MSEEPGGTRRVAGRYRLLDALGAGGMGTVWRARDEVLGREVAVKEVKAPQNLDRRDVERLYARLEREAWAAARISHRNVVTVYDVATEDGRPWIVMELVRGLSLSDVLDGEGPMPPQRAAHIGAEVLAALTAAHEAGVLHRDVKPGNVLIANDGRIVLTDFGIATVEGTSALTMTGELIGSPEFLAPERALGRTPGPESDLWSLGVLLYAAVQGSSPFRLDTPLNTLRAVVDEELPPPDRAGPLAPVIEGLLRKDPAERLSAARAGHDLRIVAAGGTPSGGPGRQDSAAYAPTTTAPTRPAPVPPTPPRTTGHAPGAASATTTAATDEGRHRRPGPVLVAGLLVLLLAAGGIAWALVDRGKGNGDGDTAGTAAGATGSGSGGGSDGAGVSGGSTPSASGDEGGGSSDGGGDGGPTYGENGGGSDGGTTAPPPEQRITVHVGADRDSYDGPCPAPEGERPAFTGTIEVTVVPATAEYRWVSSAGATGWSALSFADGGKRQEVHLAVETGTESHRAEAVLQVRADGVDQVASEPEPYTVSCDEGTGPTTGPPETADGGTGDETGDEG